MRQRAYLARARRDIIDDLARGLVLWGPASPALTGEVRQPNGDYVRAVTQRTISGMLGDGLIERHPSIKGRYILVDLDHQQQEDG